MTPASREQTANKPGKDRWGSVSLWFDTLDEAVAPRAHLQADGDLDVVVVGAGFTGLWTALELLSRESSMRVAVVEKEVAGFGASGRNGGWCSALFAVSPGRIARTAGLPAMHDLRRAMQDTVDEVGRRSSQEGIDCQFKKGGTLVVARSPAQLARLRAELDELRDLGVDEKDEAFLSPAEAGGLLGASGILGALYTPHCAAVHPGRLVRGIARAVEARGARIYERTEALEVTGGDASSGRRPCVRTRYGTLRADTVVLATEGYTAGLHGHHRDVVPLYSLMVATEPLSTALLEEIGARDGLTFSDGRHLIIYGQRTADGRIAFGGRGAPYHFSSRTRARFDSEPAVHRNLAATLVELFPSLCRARITHEWGGALGVHRDWHPSVCFDPRSGIASAGGYVGDGVATTNLAGRTLADLITGVRSDLTRLCWVDHASRRWEPEPLRWLGVNAGLAVMTLADRSEARTGRPSRLAAGFGRLTGG